MGGKGVAAPSQTPIMARLLVNLQDEGSLGNELLSAISNLEGTLLGYKENEVPGPDGSVTTEQPIMNELIQSCDIRKETLRKCLEIFNRIADEVGRRT